MPRPIRIEYEDAYYHVMNRGAGRRQIFHGDSYYKAFLDTLDEAHQRFSLQVLCYCLMKNHYHLLVKTPEGNLSRAMRHINGVYTQRHNRLRKTDGALFRGRYKAIVVEEDSYQLQLSRYIHRNPLGTVGEDELETFPWSSYPVYLGHRTAPAWLYVDEVLGQLSVKRNVNERYRAFVEMGVDEEIATFYSKGNQVPYLGSDEFREWAYQQRSTKDHGVRKADMRHFRPSLDQVLVSVAQVFDVAPSTIISRAVNRGVDNVPRWVMMYMGREVCGLTGSQIADRLGLSSAGNIPNTITKLKRRMEGDKILKKRIDSIISQY